MKEYLRILFGRLRGFLGITTIKRDLPITRFIYDSNALRADNTVKLKAFKPPKGQVGTSVYELTGLSNQEKLAHESKYGQKGRTLKAFAETSVFVANSLDLSVHYDIPPPRHAEIRGWPEKSELQLDIAQRLADDASRRHVFVCH